MTRVILVAVYLQPQCLHQTPLFRPFHHHQRGIRSVRRVNLIRSTLKHELPNHRAFLFLLSRVTHLDLRQLLAIISIDPKPRPRLIRPIFQAHIINLSNIRHPLRHHRDPRYPTVSTGLCLVEKRLQHKQYLVLFHQLLGDDLDQHSVD